MENIIVSACLLGVSCRYDGNSKPNEKIIDLKEKYNLIPICPEIMGGLPTPRMPAEIKDGRVKTENGIDVTEDGNGITAELFIKNGIDVFGENSDKCI